MQDIIANIFFGLISTVIDLINPQGLLNVVADSEGPSLFTNGNFSFVSEEMYRRVTNTCVNIGNRIAVNIVVPFLLLFIVLEVFWEIVSHTIGDDGIQKFNLRQPIIILLLLLVTSNYGLVANRIDSLSNVVVNYVTSMSAGGKDELTKMQELSGFIFQRMSQGESFGVENHSEDLKNTPNQIRTLIANAEKIKKGSEDVNAEEVAWYTKLMNAGGAQGAIELLIKWLCSGLMYLARSVIELLAWLGAAIMIAIGPLAILSYAIPGDVGKLSMKTALGSFFQFKIWIIVIGVIDLLYTRTYTAYFLDRISNTVNPGDATTLQQTMGMFMGLAFLVAYLATPKIATLLMMAGDAAGAKGAAMSSASSTKAGAGKIAKGVGAVATGGATLAKKIVS